MKFVIAICLGVAFLTACGRSPEEEAPLVVFESITSQRVTTSCAGTSQAIKVERDDTLLRLVVRNVKVRATVEQKGWANPLVATEIVARANQLESPDSIKAGQWLTLPEFCDSTFD